MINTINQHALLLNNISGNCQSKLDKTFFKVLYKSTYTKDMIENWQLLSSRETLKSIDKASKSKERERRDSLVQTTSSILESEYK